MFAVYSVLVFLMCMTHDIGVISCVAISVMALMVFFCQELYDEDAVYKRETIPGLMIFRHYLNWVDIAIYDLLIDYTPLHIRNYASLWRLASSLFHVSLFIPLILMLGVYDVNALWALPILVLLGYLRVKILETIGYKKFWFPNGVIVACVLGFVWSCL